MSLIAVNPADGSELARYEISTRRGSRRRSTAVGRVVALVAA